MFCFRILPKKRTVRENVDHMEGGGGVEQFNTLSQRLRLKRHNSLRKIVKK